MVELAFQHIEGPKGSSARPLVIAHGLLGQGRNFSTLARSFAASRDVIIVDMRNHGESPWHDEMTYPAMAGDLARLIHREAGGRASVLGHSMGGKATLALLCEAPDCVSAAIIADIAPVAYSHTHNELIDAMLSINLESSRTRRQVSDALTPRVSDPATRAFLLQNLRSGNADSAAGWRANLRVLRDAMTTLTGWVSPEGGPRYDGPVLSLRGGNSEYVDDAGRAALARDYPQTVFETIEGAGHWLHAEKPDAFNAHVERFLSQHSL